MRRSPMHWLAALHAACAGALTLATALVTTFASAQALPWFDGDRPSVQARQAVALLADAAADGLDPADYGVASLERALAAVDAGADGGARARLDAALTAAMQRFLADLHLGRIDPRQVHVKFGVPLRAFDAAGTLRAALAAQRLPEAVWAAAPQVQLYANLRKALAEYRALAAHPAWQSPLPALPGGVNGKVEPGMVWAGLPLMAQRLQALGDLATPATAGEQYDSALVEAVRAFQRRHGLIDDGVIGRATRTALEVGPAQRAQQIALTMERLRWTPLALGPRMIVVNVPEFVLRAYEVRGERFDVLLESKVIVGRALETRTPLISEELRFVEFSPTCRHPSRSRKSCRGCGATPPTGRAKASSSFCGAGRW